VDSHKIPLKNQGVVPRWTFQGLPLLYYNNLTTTRLERCVEVCGKSAVFTEENDDAKMKKHA